MNGWSKGLLGLALLGLTAGCIPSQQQMRMERDLDAMKRRLAEAERTLASRNQSPSEDRVQSLARSQADLQASLDALRVEFQTLNGRLQDQAREPEQLREELALVRDDLGLKVAALEQRIGKLESTAKTPAPAATPAAPSAPEALYAQALELIQKQGDFARGRSQLQDFLQRYPQHGLAVNAMYWIGEAYYGEKKYENAILQFQDVIQKFGDHPKVAAALLKQGLAFQALGDVKNAKVILQRVVDSFPLSDEAKKAKGYLAEWKG